MNKIRDIQIKTFPFIKENGNRLIGKCNNKGVICLYPKGISFRQERALNWREDKIKHYVKCRARAALVHEVLHLKYLNKEVKVRELTRKYFNAFIRLKGPNTNNQTILNQHTGSSSLDFIKASFAFIRLNFSPKPKHDCEII
jgi:hypothetical protein